VSESTYRARIELLQRRKESLEARRLEAVDHAIRLEAELAEKKIVAGHRRQARRLEEMIDEVEGEITRLEETLSHGVAIWVGGEAKLPDLPKLPESAVLEERTSLEPRNPRPVTPAGRRRSREQARRRSAPLLTVLACSSGRAGRHALNDELHELEDWLDAAGHSDRVEIDPVHAHRFPDLEPAFEHRRPAVVHIVGRPRKPEALLEPLSAAAGNLKLVYLSADRSLDEAAWLAEGVPVAIGTPRGLDADVKAAFAAILYAALARGMSLAEAFGRAQTALAAARMTNGEGPRMFARIAANPAEITVVSRAPAPRTDAAESFTGRQPPLGELRAA
jgi:hypothetical protein